MNEARITIGINPPCHGERKSITISLSRDMYEKLARPLPRMREIDPRDYHAGVEQMGERQSVAKWIAGEITQRLLGLAEDTIHGYSRKEWDDMHRAPSPHPFNRKETD